MSFKLFLGVDFPMATEHFGRFWGSCSNDDPKCGNNGNGSCSLEDVMASHVNTGSLRTYDFMQTMVNAFIQIPCLALYDLLSF